MDHSTKKLVVTVTSKSDAHAVRSRRRRPQGRPVQRRPAPAGHSSLDSTAKIPGTAWAVDPVTNQVVVSVTARSPAPSSRAQGRRRPRSAPPPGSRRAGHVQHLITGGDAIYGGAVPLLARLQRPQRQHVLLPDRRALHQHRRDLVPQLRATPRCSAPRPAPASRATTTRIVQYTTPSTAPGTVGSQDITSPATPSSARRSPAAAAPPASTAARSRRSTPPSTTPRAPSPA